MIERGQEWKVLDKGFIRYIDHLGSDESICSAARISYGKGTKSVNDNRNLIRYLMRHKHTSPTEMCELIIHVKAPIYVFRQWHRHRMASLNEYSGRYSEMIDDMEITDQWRLQSTNNKQGSQEGNLQWPEGDNAVTHIKGTTPEQYLILGEKEIHRQSRFLYETRLKLGIAKEQARKDLPVSNYSEMVWKCDLHNLLHFLSLRMDSHAQKEIRDYATIIGDKIVSELWPITYEAFQNYRLKSVTFSEYEFFALKDIMWNLDSGAILDNEHHNQVLNSFENKRERQEFEDKLKRLGIEE